MSSAIRDKIYAYFSQYPKRTYPKGQILVFANENPTNVFYLESGKVRKYDVSYRGDEVIVNIFKPLVFFPMSWALNEIPNKYFYKTEEPSVMYVVPPADVIKFLKTNPDVAVYFMARIYKTMDNMLGRMVHLMSGTAKSRLIYELIIEGHRFGKKMKDSSIMLNITESDIAARTGLSRETVNREMRKLKDQGEVTISSQGIVITDVTALETEHAREL
jgi:CRP-like cAMP-binding protein